MRILALIAFATIALPAVFLLAADPKGPTPVRVLTVPDFTEGVVFDRDGAGYISHDKTVTRFTPDGKHAPWAETGGPNGHKILADGTHLLCDRTHKAVLRLSKDGKLLDPAAAKAFDGKPLLGPNDLTLDPANGGFYFTDPEGSDLKTPIGAVYHVDATTGQGKVTRVDEGLAYPNGIVLTPDGKRLYLGESATNQIHVYDVLAPGKLSKRRLLADLPKADKSKGQIDHQPDGMCLDASGNLYVAHFGMGQVQVLTPEGKLLASHPTGNLSSSNVAFAGPEAKDLYVTGAIGEFGKSEGAVFRLTLNVKGLSVLPK
jgi:gluconolactonase